MRTIVNFVKGLLVLVVILSVGFVTCVGYFNSHARINMGGDMKAMAIDIPGDMVIVVEQPINGEKFTNVFGKDISFGYEFINNENYVDLGDGRFIDQYNVKCYK